MNVTKLTDNMKACDNCQCHSEAAYMVTIKDISILICVECKHDLTYELISN